MKKINFYILLLISLFFLACNEKNSDNSSLENKQILYTVMPKSDYTLEITNYSSNERGLITQLWEGLTELKNNGVRMVGVNKIEHSPDFKEWTFYLRDDLKWSNGEKISADTFAKSWIDTLAKENNSDEIYRMFVIKGAEDFHNKNTNISTLGIKTDGNILKVILNKSVDNFDEWVSNPIFYPIYDRNKNLLPTELVVNGPFKIKDFSNEQIILEKNNQYWDNVNTRLKEIVINLVEDEIMAYEMFSRNEIDFFGAPFYSIPFDRLNQVNSLPEKIVVPVMRYLYISMPNIKNEKIFSKKEIRKLMYDVTDPEFIGDSILKNNSPAIFEHPHPSSSVLSDAKEKFEKIKNINNFKIEDLVFVAHFNENNKIEKRILLSTVKEWISSFKFPIKVTSNAKNDEITFDIKDYLVGTNKKEDFYYYLNKKFNLRIENENDFLNDLPVIPILQKNETILLHSNVRGLLVSPNGDIYFKYINID